MWCGLILGCGSPAWRSPSARVASASSQWTALRSCTSQYSRRVARSSQGIPPGSGSRSGWLLRRCAHPTTTYFYVSPSPRPGIEESLHGLCVWWSWSLCVRLGGAAALGRSPPAVELPAQLPSGTGSGCPCSAVATATRLAAAVRPARSDHSWPSEVAGMLEARPSRSGRSGCRPPGSWRGSATTGRRRPRRRWRSA